MFELGLTVKVHLDILRLKAAKLWYWCRANFLGANEVQIDPEQCCRDLQVTPRTLYNWLSSEVFFHPRAYGEAIKPKSIKEVLTAARLTTSGPSARVPMCDLVQPKRIVALLGQIYLQEQKRQRKQKSGLIVSTSQGLFAKEVDTNQAKGFLERKLPTAEKAGMLYVNAEWQHFGVRQEEAATYVGWSIATHRRWLKGAKVLRCARTFEGIDLLYQQAVESTNSQEAYNLRLQQEGLPLNKIYNYCKVFFVKAREQFISTTNIYYPCYNVVGADSHKILTLQVNY